MRSSLKEKIIFIMALLLMNYRVDLIGSMSLTEIYVVTQIPHLLKWLYGYGKKIPNLHKIVKGFYLLIGTQCLAEFMVGNSLTNAMKGVAVTIMALFLMLFFMERLIKDISLIVWIPICSAVGLIIFGDQFGFSETGQTTYFKFYIAPLITSMACAATLIKWKWFQRNVFLLLFGVSLFVIIGGARSLGFSLFFTVLIYLIYSHYKSIHFKKIIPGLLIAIIAVQSFLTFVYMPKVKNGEWGSNQNREQFEMIGWNSNIFMLIFAARTDFFVSSMAFMDKPLWGHGSWAVDKSRKYYILQAKLLGQKQRDPETLRMIPNHSVVIGKGVANGIFAFIVFLWIFLSMYKIGIKGLAKDSPYNIYLIWTIIASFQHLMFGPPAILKNNGAIAFAIMFAFYYINHRKNGTKNRIIRCNSNV